MEREKNNKICIQILNIYAKKTGTCHSGIKGKILPNFLFLDSFFRIQVLYEYIIFLLCLLYGH